MEQPSQNLNQDLNMLIGNTNDQYHDSEPDFKSVENDLVIEDHLTTPTKTRQVVKTFNMTDGTFETQTIGTSKKIMTSKYVY